MPYNRLRKATEDANKRNGGRQADEDTSSLFLDQVPNKQASAILPPAIQLPVFCCNISNLKLKLRDAAQVSDKINQVPQGAFDHVPELKPDYATQQKLNGGRFAEPPSSDHRPEEATTTNQPDLFIPALPAESGTHSDSGAQSEEEDNFEEREDDRANDPACIECDDGGIMLVHMSTFYAA